MARINLLPDSKVYVDPGGDKYKADKFEILCFEPMDRWWNDETFCLAAVAGDGHALKFVKKQTDDICRTAVNIPVCLSVCLSVRPFVRASVCLPIF